jgi:hypothetical protein
VSQSSLTIHSLTAADREWVRAFIDVARPDGWMEGDEGW